MRSSSDEDTLAPRRRVKQHKSWKSERTKTWKKDSQLQKKSQDKVFNSNSGSEMVALKQPSPQQPQSVRMYLRRGRTISREKILTSSESEGSRFGLHCAEDGVSAVQKPGGKEKTRFNQKHLQQVICRGKHSTPCSDSDSGSTQPQVQNSADSDDLFTPPEPIKGCRTKALKQTSQLISPAFKSADSKDFSAQQVANGRISQKQRKCAKNFKNNIITNSGDESSSEKIREDKSNDSWSVPKRTRQKKSLRVSKRTTNRHARVDKQPDRSKKTDNSQPSVANNAGKTTKPSVKNKTIKGNNKKQTAKHPEFEQDLEGAWTEKELQKLNE